MPVKKNVWFLLSTEKKSGQELCLLYYSVPRLQLLAYLPGNGKQVIT